MDRTLTDVQAHRAQAVQELETIENSLRALLQQALLLRERTRHCKTTIEVCNELERRLGDAAADPTADDGGDGGRADEQNED